MIQVERREKKLAGMTVSFDGELVAVLGKIAVCFEEQSSCEKMSGGETKIEVATMLELERMSWIQEPNLVYDA
jgi:hypothetical protein